MPRLSGWGYVLRVEEAVFGKLFRFGGKLLISTTCENAPRRRRSHPPARGEREELGVREEWRLVCAQRALAKRQAWSPLSMPSRF